MPEQAPCQLASAHEVESPVFRKFMEDLNRFASQYGLYQFDGWSKNWEYPWLWKNGLKATAGNGGLDIVDMGSEMSPFPWFLASMGNRVTLVEVEERWQPFWEKIRDASGFDVQWTTTSSEAIPVMGNSADLITSLSVIEHIPAKAAALEEILRVLKPGGHLAISFDICEPELGMHFPEWNGEAFTRESFESVFWSHPAWAQANPPQWDGERIQPFLEWHLRSAPHHSYVTAAAFLKNHLQD